MKIEVLEGYDPVLDLKYYIDIVDNETGEVLKQYQGWIPRSYLELNGVDRSINKMMDNISRRKDIRKWLDDNHLTIAHVKVPDSRDMKVGRRPWWTVYVKPINGKGDLR